MDREAPATRFFSPTRDREACSAIRGYVYQIDRTIDRWLNLSSDQRLELERGEDIDIVGQCMLVDDSSRETRLLEQVKHRERRITLRTDCALEALANFHDHCASNPQLDLRFCFVTNATIGREQLDPFPNHAPGIALWEQIRCANLPKDQIPGALASLRRFIASLPKPQVLPVGVWSRFQEFAAVSSVDQLSSFIGRFEWMTEALEADQLPSELCRKVLTLGLATSDVLAKEVYNRLFVHVARLLCNAGDKQLSKKDLLEVASTPTLGSADHEFLRRLESVVTRHGKKLDQIETQLCELGDQVTKLLIRSEENTLVEFAVQAAEISVPPKVAKLSARATTVVRLAGRLESHLWLALHGGPDIGKSQLAVLIVEFNSRCRCWIRLHHAQGTTDAIRTFETALMRAAGLEGLPLGSGWFADIARKFGVGEMIVLDDMPRMTSDDLFAQTLVLFGQACQSAGVRIVSTSRYSLPSRIRHLLGDDLVSDESAPMFKDDEALELFQAHGAPISLLQSRAVTFMNALAAGHPLLLTAIADFLRSRNWVYRQNEAIALLRGEHTQLVLPDVLTRLTRSLGEVQRDLLYRLTLPIGSFTSTEVIELAAANPTIDRPSERLNEILGAWVQQESNTRMNVSPLVKSFGQTELGEETRKACYRKLAELITQRRVMRLDEADHAILYNLSAKEFGRAATLYLIALVSTLSHPKNDYAGEVIAKWQSTRLPEEMGIGMCLCVRAYQLAAFLKYDYEVDFVVRDIDALLSRAVERDGWGIIAVAVQAALHYARLDIDRVMDYVIRAVSLPSIYHVNGEKIRFHKLFPPDLLWTLVTRLNTPKRLDRWLTAVEHLPKTARQRFWRAKLANPGIQLVPNQIYLAEWDKQAELRNWAVVLLALNNLRERAQKLKQPLLEASASRMIVTIHGDLKQLDAMTNEAEATLSKWPQNGEVQFLILSEWGRQCTYNGRHDLARPLLEKSLKAECAGYDHERLLALLAASDSFAAKDPASGLYFAEQALNLARKSESIAPIQAVKALGEYSLAICFATQGQLGAVAAFSAWSETIEKMMEVRREGKIWRDAMGRLGHVTAYFAQLARGGSPPNLTEDGSEFIPPSRGFLTKFSNEMAEWYRPGGEAGLFFIMAEYAEAAQSPAKRAYWLSKAMEEARSSGAAFVLPAIWYRQIPELIKADLFEDAVEASVKAARGMAVNRVQPPKPDDPHTLTRNLVAEFAGLLSGQRQEADRHAVISGVIPIAFRIVQNSLNDPALGMNAAERVCSVCRLIASEDIAYRELWSGAADLFALASGDQIDRRRLLERAQELGRAGFNELHVLGFILGTSHLPPEEAIKLQLVCVELLFKWYPPNEPTHRYVVLPYVESYWLNVAQHCRFYLRAPSITAEAITTAAQSPESDRVRRILRAAVSGFRLTEYSDAIRWLTRS